MGRVGRRKGEEVVSRGVREEAAKSAELWWLCKRRVGGGLAVVSDGSRWGGRTGMRGGGKGDFDCGRAGDGGRLRPGTTDSSLVDSTSSSLDLSLRLLSSTTTQPPPPHHHSPTGMR